MLGKSYSKFKPTALGTLVNASTYGQTIPVIVGCTQGSLYVIWAANIRQGSSSTKKFKSKKKGTPIYVENVDFLLATNPIIGPLQLWANGQSKYALNFVSADFHGPTFTITDPLFYCVIAVTYAVSGPARPGITFDDFGGPGPVPASDAPGIYTLWNMAFAGPNPTDSNYRRFWPFCYFNLPYSPDVDITPISRAPYINPVTVWYAQLVATGKVPLAGLRLTYEAKLGMGTEYSDANLSSQQIIYPHYAGLESSDIDLGSGGVLPQIKVETLGSFGIWAPRGDADFTDMIDYIIRSGQVQQALGFFGTGLSPLQLGLGCWDYPGVVQAYADNDGRAIQYGMPNTPGNFLIAAVNQASVASFSISDDPPFPGDAWVPVLPTGHQAQVWTAKSGGWHAGNHVYITPASNRHIYELGGVDTLDATAQVTGTTSVAPTLSITSTVNPGESGYIMVIIALSNNFGDVGGTLPGPDAALWKPLLAYNLGQAFATPINNFFYNPNTPTPTLASYFRVITQPGTYTVTFANFAAAAGPGVPYQLVMLAFKNSQPVNYPKPLGNIIDDTTLQLTRAQCHAYGLYGSMTMDTQKKGSDWLADLYIAANAAPVWSGFVLKSIPLAEQSFFGNGVAYYSPTATGPQFTLKESDLLGDNDQPLITVERNARVDLPAILQYQHPNRSSDYNQVVTAQPDQGVLALYGVRKDSPKPMTMFQDVSIARMVLAVQERRANNLLNTYKFKAGARFKFMEAMDLVYVNDSKQGINMLPVRLKSIAEDKDYNLDCEAEDFFYGISAPIQVTVTPPNPYAPALNGTPAAVNVPIFIEPVPRLSGQTNVNDLWIVVSDVDPTYGGCLVYVSTDGGGSYQPLGTIVGSAVTGFSTNDWPAAIDPDTADDLHLNLSESLGELLSYSVADEDNFVYPCWIDGGVGGGPSYELMTYAVASLTGTHLYTLSASGGNHLRRSVFGAPKPDTGVDHPIHSRWAFLDPAGKGILKVQMDQIWLGQTLFFKFAQFNEFGGGGASLSTLTPYSYTPNNNVGNMNGDWSNYTLDPPNVLSWDLSHLQIDVNGNNATPPRSWIKVNFPSNSVTYAGRQITIANPGSATVTYYVTIYDPHQTGDPGGPFGSPTLTSFAETSNAKVGQTGYVYMGSITINANVPGGILVTPGGWPPEQLFLVNGT